MSTCQQIGTPGHPFIAPPNSAPGVTLRPNPRPSVHPQGMSDDRGPGVFILEIVMVSGKRISRQLSPVCEYSYRLDEKYTGYGSLVKAIRRMRCFLPAFNTIKEARVRFEEL
jgi:hypothetical protein